MERAFLVKNYISAVSQIEEEKGISREKILETVELAIAAAYKKDYGQRGQIIKAKLDSATGKFDIRQKKIIPRHSQRMFCVLTLMSGKILDASPRKLPSR